MTRSRLRARLILSTAVTAGLLVWAIESRGPHRADAADQSEFQAQNEVLFEQLQQVHGLDDGQMTAIRAIFTASGVVGQGNPAVARHPVTPEQCQAPDQMSSAGSSELGYTEMKGSWFIFDRYYAHQDWCRWRAPYWHGSRVMDSHSHHNYHLGFRCCNTVGEARQAAVPEAAASTTSD